MAERQISVDLTPGPASPPARPRRRRRARPLRNHAQIQRMLESLFSQVMDRQQYLEEGDPGYVQGQNTPNPTYWVLTDKERLAILNRQIGHLIELIPIRETEDKVSDLEHQIEELMAQIHERAPWMLQGGGE